MPNVIETTDAAAGTATAYSLTPGQAAQGAIGTTGDHDWYRVSLTGGQTYTVALVGTGSAGVTDPFVQVYGSNGTTVVASNDDGLPNNNSVVTFTASATGTYYIDAGAWNNTGTGQYGVSITTGSRATADVPMGAGIIDAYSAYGNNEYAWNSTPGTGVTVTVGFRITDDGTESNFSQFSAQQRTAMELILQYYRDVCGLNLVNAGQTDNATILLSNYNYNDNSGGYAQYPGSAAASAQDGNIHINIAGGNSTTSVTAGSYSFFTLMHEFGHAVGLSHPGLYNAGVGVTITYGSNAQFTQDTHQYTVMSYFDESNTTGSYGSYPDGLMLYDIYALQQIYGANLATRAGATVYGFNATAGGIYDFTSNTSPTLCIWDGGGIDTLDLSGYGAGQSISLVAGTFSNVGGLTGNISIAYGCTIENAVGGSGNDTILGNAADNLLRGGGGTDTIDGGAGRDTVVFTGTRAAATISHNTATNAWTITSAGQTATLTNVEVAQFSDRTVALGVHPKADFDGNGCTDMLWRSSWGAVYQNLMNGGQILSSKNIGGDSNWSYVGSGDFNGDGNTDVLWRSSWGAVYQNLMDGAQILSSTNIGGDSNWSYIGSGDFNGDGNTDVLWRSSWGAVYQNLMDGSQILSSTHIGGDSSTWSFFDTGDFNGDGRTDVLWRASSGALYQNLMNGAQILSSTYVGGDSTWTPIVA